MSTSKRLTLTRRELLSGAIAASACALVDSPQRAEARGRTRPKNVLFLMTDEYNRNYMSFRGHEQALTPNIDRLARGGVVFENAHCSHPVCTASRCSIHTGMWPFVHKVHNNVDPPSFYTDIHPLLGLPAVTTMMASVFQDHGYKCYHRGKWHMGSELRHRCYNWSPRLKYPAPRDWYLETDEWLKSNPGPKPVPDDCVGCYPWPVQVIPGMRKFVESPNHGYISGRATWPLERDYTTYITDQAVADMDDSGGKPFMITWSDPGPHGDHTVPDPYYHAIDPADIPMPTNLDRPDYLKDDPSCAWYDKIQDLAGEAGHREYLRCYCGMIRKIDDAVGRLLNSLEERGELDDTLIVMTADHGDMCNAHRTTGGKAVWAFYDEIARVPLIFHWPRGIKPGRRVETPVDGVDVMPTILDYAGLPIPKQCQGTSLRRFIEGAEDPNRMACCEATAQQSQVVRRMIRTQEWALWIFYANWSSPDRTFSQARPLMMFDMVNDPGQQRNLGDDPKYADIRKRLLKRLAGWMEEKNDAWLRLLPRLT